MITKRLRPIGDESLVHATRLVTNVSRKVTAEGEGKLECIVGREKITNEYQWWLQGWLLWHTASESLHWKKGSPEFCCIRSYFLNIYGKVDVR